MIILSYEVSNLRNVYIAALSGFFFTTAWWILIDVGCTYANIMDNNKLYYLPGFCSTAAMSVVYLTPYRTSQDDYFYGSNKCSYRAVQVILFLGLVFSFSSYIWAVYIWIADFILKKMPVWPGLGIMLQNLLILLSNLQMKFAVTSEND